jgi:hypothetical protein
MVKQTPSKGKGRTAPARTKNSTRIFYLALAVVAVAGIGALSWMSRRPADRLVSPIDSTLPKVQSNGYVIRFRWIDFPLSMHRNTWPASRAAACADEQGKFWEMHDALFQAQDEWNGESTNNPNPIFKRMAGQLGLNQQQFDQCVDTKKYQAKVQAHEQLAEQQHIGATPSFIVGGKIVEGPRPYDEFKSIVDDALAKSGSPMATPSDTAATKAKRPAKSGTAR